MCLLQAGRPAPLLSSPLRSAPVLRFPDRQGREHFATCMKVPVEQRELNGGDGR